MQGLSDSAGHQSTITMKSHEDFGSAVPQAGAFSTSRPKAYAFKLIRLAGYADTSSTGTDACSNTRHRHVSAIFDYQVPA